MNVPPQQLRIVADTIITQLAKLHGSNLIVTQLASAIINLLSIQDTNNADLRATLQAERRHRLRLEGRVTALESAHPRVVYHESQSEDAHGNNIDNISEFQPIPPPMDNNNGNDRPDDCEANEITKDEATKNVAQDAQDAQDVTNNHKPQPSTKTRRLMSPKNQSNDAIQPQTQVQPPTKSTIHRRESSPRQQIETRVTFHDNFNYNHSRKRRRKASDILPTLAETTRHQQRQQQERRQAAKREPLPCAKCRVRKRADMQREKGRVDEELFERWARKPGGCLGFMHMDDRPILRNSLSFAETETESPPHR